MRIAVVLVVAAAAVAAVAWLGDDADRAPAPPAAEDDPAPTPAATRGGHRSATRRLRPARCPADAANCRAVTGRVLYVEAVDPDGDGDAHYVLAGGDVTFPGVSVIDVEADLRPRRLPRLGDLVTAAGPVYEGSHGQRQIQATEVRQRRR